MTSTNENDAASALALATGSATDAARLEAIRKQLCAVGLHPTFHDTAEKAASAVCEMIAHFRRELADPPADVCGLVMRKYGVFGFMEEGEEPRCRLVSLPNAQDQPTSRDRQSATPSTQENLCLTKRKK